MAMVGCSKKTGGGSDDPVASNFDAIEKEWKLVSVNGEANEFNVYISFDQGTFALYQQVYTLDYKFYDGEYEVEGGKLTGEYFEGGAWKCAYTGGVSEDGNTLTIASPVANCYPSLVYNFEGYGWMAYYYGASDIVLTRK